MLNRTIGRAAASFVLALSLSSCSVAPDRTAIEPPLPAQFALAGETAAPDLWWQAFADQELDNWQAVALADNPGVQIIAARWRAAQAVARGSAAGLIPSLSASIGQTRSGGDQPHTELSSGGLSAAYELDLWGRIRAGRDASRLQAAAAARELAAAQVEAW